MFAKNKAVGVCLAALCGTVAAQTIDEISELNRQAVIAEAKSKIEAAKRAGGGSVSTPTPPASGVPGIPLGAGQPVGAPAPAAPAWKAVPPKKERTPAPVLMAIYGVGGNLIAELSDAGFEGKYREGDKTPNGWTISRIEKRNVIVTRPGSSKGKGKAATPETVSLPFGVKTEVPKETVSVARDQTPGNFSMPPLPPSFTAGGK